MIADTPLSIDRAPAPSPRQGPARGRILEAAAAEFAERGRNGVRMEHVARRAGCNKALVYRYFKNRETLFRAVLARLFEERDQTRKQVPKDLSDALPHWFRETVGAREFLYLIMREALADDGSELVEEAARRHYYREQIASLDEAQRAGDVSSHLDSTMLFLALLSLITFPGAFPQITRLVTGMDPDSRSFERRWAALLRGLAHELEPDQEPTT